MTRILLASALLLACSLHSQAQLVFTENFDSGTSAANWTTNVSSLTAINTADFAFDYSTVGIPSAPNSIGGTTTGLMLRANRPGPSPIFSGLSVSPNGQSFTGDYILQFDAWQNFPGPLLAGGTGSTQVTAGGIGVNTGTVQFPGTAIDGVLFGGTGDGGSGQDYRAYTNSGAPLADTSGVYAAGNTTGVTNNTNAFYSANGFGGVAAPPDQLALFPSQTGSTGVGTLGMTWRTWTIEKNSNIVTWSVTNNSGISILLATVDISLAGNELNGTNIALAHFDVNSTTTNADGDPLLFGLFDNVTVTIIPEPSTMLLGGVVAVFGLRRIRRSTR